jgi:hypothetical protein
MDILEEFRWRPTIGDPSLMGWLTVAAYGVAALLALWVWYRQKNQLWLFVALGMTLLCLNKQLDLQSLFTDIGRVASHHLGFYEVRRDFQKWFVLGVVGGAGIFSAWFVFRHHAFWLRHKLLSSGLLFLMTFIVVRAISFHHFDMFLKSRFLGMKMNWTLELGGILLVGLAAGMELAKPAKPK